MLVALILVVKTVRSLYERPVNQRLEPTTKLDMHSGGNGIKVTIVSGLLSFHHRDI